MKAKADRKRILGAMPILAAIVAALSLCACGNKITLDKQLDNVDKLVIADVDGALVAREAIDDVLSAFRGLRLTETDDRYKDNRTPLVVGFSNDIKCLEISLDGSGRAYVMLYEPDGEFKEYCSSVRAVDRDKFDETVSKYK